MYIAISVETYDVTQFSIQAVPRVWLLSPVEISSAEAFIIFVPSEISMGVQDGRVSI
jgi:hypothetical protein